MKLTLFSSGVIILTAITGFSLQTQTLQGAKVVAKQSIGYQFAAKSSSANQSLPNPATHSAYASDRIIVRFKPNISRQNQLQTHAVLQAKVLYDATSVANLQFIELPTGTTVEAALDRYRSNQNVLYAEPDYRLDLHATFPDDTRFSELWALHNTGETVGVADADINAPEAWDITTGVAPGSGAEEVVVAVIDTGIDYTHLDLAANIWVNPGEIPNNNIDDDGNGFVDDIHGIDTAVNDSDPMDEFGHGTHVAGTIGASGAQGADAIGVVGVNWNIKIIACKMFASFGAFISDGIECLDYIHDLKTMRGINIIATNNSYGRIGPASQAMQDAIQKQLDAGILFVASAGNSGLDSDIVRHYPSSYYYPNVISVAATDYDDALVSFSTYGSRSVHIGAPGLQILSTVPGKDFPLPAINPQSDVYLEDVETATTSAWQMDPDWAVSNINGYLSVQAFTDSIDGSYANNLDSSLVSPAINLSAYSNSPAYLAFFAQYHIEFQYDRVFVDVSGDDGATWRTLTTITGDSLDWKFFSYEIPLSAKTAMFKLRFRLLTDESITADGISIDNIGIGTSLYDKGPAGSNMYLVASGTSMASPHTVGVLGLLAAQDPTRDWRALKNLVISSGTPLADLEMKSVSGRRLRAADIDGTGALTCINQTVQSRLWPRIDKQPMLKTEILSLSVLNINCEAAAGDLTVTVDETGAVVTLLDDGIGFDQVAGDGIYSTEVDLSQFDLPSVSFSFPDGSTSTIEFVKNYSAAVNVEYQWRDISNVSTVLSKNDFYMNIVTSPFPIYYSNSSSGLRKLGVASNGYLMLRERQDIQSVVPLFFGEPLPYSEVSNLIAPFWGVLSVGGGTVSWGVLGDAPSRQLVVEWNDVGYYFGTGTIAFQTVFFENSSNVLFNYKDVVFGDGTAFEDFGGRASVGLQVSQNNGQQYSFESPNLTDNSALLWTIPSTGPTLEPIGDRSVIEHRALRFSIVANDIDPGAPLLRADNLPSGAEFDPLTREFYWEAAGPVGDYQVTFVAVDRNDPTLTATETITITVNKDTSGDNGGSLHYAWLLILLISIIGKMSRRWG